MPTDWPENQPEPENEEEEQVIEIRQRPASLDFVDSRERVEIAHYEREAEAELAAGMLRANGIAAEVGTPIIPGLNYSLTLWVRKGQEALARQLLQQAEEGDFRD
ncbi:MAG TPA: hypothetical protein VE996_02215 [Terriglobales bacterium]|nr:hypothetical protein [Terriglobales bacterium]